LHIDESLLREAKSASGAKTDTDTVRLALRRWSVTVRTSAFERFVDLNRMHATPGAGVSVRDRSSTRPHDR
jgi:Bacterial antitoxin of type II TA system, VapB